jgi:hypothetical protein
VTALPSCETTPLPHRCRAEAKNADPLRTHSRRTHDFVAAMLLALVLLAGCDVKVNDEGLDAGDPVRRAAATATVSAVRISDRNAQLDIAIRETAAAQEVEAHNVTIEATRAAITANVTKTLIMADAQAQAQSKTIEAQGAASAQATSALGTAGYITILVMGVSLAISAFVLATGYSIAHVKGAVLAANYVQIGVEARTLLPPPIIITADGYMIDTRSGERARLRDAVGVDRLRLAATTHTTEVAQLAQAEVEIAKSTRDTRPGDALMGAAGAVPMLDTGGTE